MGKIRVDGKGGHRPLGRRGQGENFARVQFTRRVRKSGEGVDECEDSADQGIYIFHQEFVLVPVLFFVKLELAKILQMPLTAHRDCAKLLRVRKALFKEEDDEITR